MISRRTLGWVILIWTVVSWGGRIGLLTGPEAGELWSWVRIGGSFLVGLVAAASFVVGHLVRPIGYVFAAWTSSIWIRSSISVWAEPNTPGFRLVHMALAVVWLVVAALAVGKAHVTGSATGDSATGVPGATMSPKADTTSSIDR